jgi:hypothetical protein
MPLNLYLAIRFGNADSPDGPDGEDTHFLVRAPTVQEAARITDEHLRDMPTSSPDSERPVQPFCHRMVELGADASATAEPHIITGPLLARIKLSAGYRVWMREDGWCDDWRDVNDVFAAELP